MPSLVSAPLCFISCLVLKYWIAYTVCMGINRDKNTQMLPLILSTSVTLQQIIFTQIKNVFKRMFVPLFLTFLIILNYVIYYPVALEKPSIVEVPPPSINIFTLVYIPIAYGVILLLADLIALIVVGIHSALRTKTIQNAFSRTLTITLAIPWFILYISVVPWMKRKQISSLGQSPWVLIAITFFCFIRCYVMPFLL